LNQVNWRWFAALTLAVGSALMPVEHPLKKEEYPMDEAAKPKWSGFILLPICVLLISAELMSIKSVAVGYQIQDKVQDKVRRPVTEIDLTRSGLAGPDAGKFVDKPGSAAHAAGTEELALDNGTPEVAIAADGLIAVNRLTPSAYPATLQTVRIFLAALPGRPTPVGAQLKLVAFAGAAGTTAPPNNPTLLVNQTVTIPALPDEGGFIDFPIQNGPVISSGDIYVGFQLPNPAGGVALIADTNGAQRQRGFASDDNGQTYFGPVTLQNGSPINLMIRESTLHRS
jgi:hypothetical protein